YLEKNENENTSGISRDSEIKTILANMVKPLPTTSEADCREWREPRRGRNKKRMSCP
uniref:Uncharacterized protein n=1 Tax=Astyanax mexicanus TaxID=7994 RepID=A0A3B1IVR2_ASTMX